MPQLGPRFATSRRHDQAVSSGPWRRSRTRRLRSRHCADQHPDHRRLCGRVCGHGFGPGAGAQDRSHGRGAAWPHRSAGIGRHDDRTGRCCRRVDHPGAAVRSDDHLGSVSGVGVLSPVRPGGDHRNRPTKTTAGHPHCRDRRPFGHSDQRRGGVRPYRAAAFRRAGSTRAPF
jgi:hypothetical protein